jgi:hypothetical protein
MGAIKYKEINELLQHLLARIYTILTNEFIGMYVGGSLAGDSFNYETSDIDCYIVTTESLSPKILNQIEEMHKQVYASKRPYAKKLEASYIPRTDLLDFNPMATRPYFNEGQYYLGQYGNNYSIELYVLRENGITLAGPDIKDLINPISIQTLQSAIQKNLNEYWSISLTDVKKFKRSDYQVFAILTMCRTLYSLATGKITSKIEAAGWAIKWLDNHWKTLIELAIAWKPGEEIDRLEETLNFVKYVIMQNRSQSSPRF